MPDNPLYPHTQGQDAEGTQPSGLPMTVAFKDASGNVKIPVITALSFPLAQGAAGTTEIAAASVGNKHKIVGAVLTMDAAGTVKFIDDAGDLTGPMTVADAGGFVIPTSIIAMIETSTTNTALSIVTTGGAASGVIRYLTEP